jgi:hypothetical protein
VGNKRVLFQKVWKPGANKTLKISPLRAVTFPLLKT